MNDHQINELVSLAIALGSMLLAYLKANAADCAQKEAADENKINELLIQKFQELTGKMDQDTARRTKQEIKVNAESLGVEDKLHKKVVKLTKQTPVFTEEE